MIRNLLLATASLAMLSAAPLAAQTRAGEDAAAREKPGKPETEKPDPDVARASAVEDAQPKRGKVTLASGRPLAYTATPGTLTIRNDDGEPIASMFYTAYTVDQPKGARPRPVTFAYNGGPGSSTMWLHMGSVAPVRVQTLRPEAQPNAPFEIGENPYTILDHSDIVFIDAIGTGLSRPVGKGKGPDFWGVDQDIDAFAKGIMRYISINNRWNAPKFLFGESYGTLRSAGLVDALQDRGVQVNGVILLSSILNYGIRQPGYDQIHVTYLPSYAATAWYHNRLANRPATLEPFLTEVRAWARGPYATALAKGDELPDAERAQIAQQLSAYTGLSPDFLIRANLRVDLQRFRKELLRDRHRTVGRLDSRFTGIDADDAGDGPEYDATDTAISGAYIAGLNDYLFGTLGYRTPLTYRPNYYSGIAGKWDQKHRAPGGRGYGAQMALADTALDLSQAMRQNPHLKVLSLNGYYDMATPFFGAEYDLKHMGLPPELRRNLTYRYYESGHMVYVSPEVRPQFVKDMDEFIDAARRPP
jgi:carboxypeptidase C (cathepsin A)